MAASAPLPQLLMRRPTLRGLPSADVPGGYVLRHFRAGDEVGWNAVMDLAFRRRPGQSDFAREMAADPVFRPERVWLVLDGAGTVAATASCWRAARYGRDAAVLHWVAAHPDHGGCRLGWWVSLAALHQGAAEGCLRAYLLTDDVRVAALKTYLRMGFEPVVTDPSHPDRWRRILRDLAWKRRFETVLSGPPESFPEAG